MRRTRCAQSFVSLSGSLHFARSRTGRRRHPHHRPAADRPPASDRHRRRRRARTQAPGIRAARNLGQTPGGRFHPEPVARCGLARTRSDRRRTHHRRPRAAPAIEARRGTQYSDRIGNGLRALPTRQETQDLIGIEEGKTRRVQSRAHCPVGESPTEAKRLKLRSLGGAVARKQDDGALRQHARKECAQSTRLQRSSERRCSLVTRSIRWLRRSITRESSKSRIETSPMRRLSPAGYQRRHGVKDGVSTGETLDVRRGNLAEEMTGYNREWEMPA